MKIKQEIVVIATMTASSKLMTSMRGEKRVVPWLLPESVQYYKNITQGSALIVESETLQNFLFLTQERYCIYLAPNKLPIEGAYHATCLKEAINLAYDLSESDTTYILGSADIVPLAWKENLVDKMVLTKIYKDIAPGIDPIFFPDIPSDWEQKDIKNLRVSDYSIPADLKYGIELYTKKNSF